MTLTEIAIKRPSLIIVIFTILVGSGWFALNNLNYELLPSFSQPVIVVTTPYPGASPSEVEQQVTKKMEDAFSDLEGLDEIKSKSLESASIVIVTFRHGAKLDVLMQEAQRRIERIKKDLPTEVKNSVMSKISPSDQPIMTLILNANIDDRVFRQKVEDELLPQFQQIKGLADIKLVGGERREIRINVNQDKLRFYNLSLLQVTQVLKNANLEFPTGKVKNPDEQVTVRLAGKLQTLQELKKLIIFTNPQNSSPIRLEDVAEVKDAIRDIESISRLNGKNGLSLIIRRQSDGNAVEVSKNVQKKLAQLEKHYASIGLAGKVVDDSSVFTLKSVDAVMHDLELAVFLVSVVMLLFLHSLRNSLIVLVSIPASLMSTFALMYLFGYSLNLMTLLAMSLVIGILVDDSIVVLENIYRHLEMGKAPRQAALEGRNEIGFTALSITMVDVVVFLPIVFVNTTISDVLKQFSLVVVISTLFSLFVCFTLTPWLASRFAKVTHLSPKNPFQYILIQFEKILDSFTNNYASVVSWFLKHKIVGFGFIALFFVGTSFMMRLGIMGEEFIKEGDTGKFMFRLKYDESTPLTSNNLATQKIENILRQDAAVEYVFANIGGASTGVMSTGLGAENRAELTVQLKKSHTLPTDAYMMKARKLVEEKITGVEISASIVGMVNTGGAPIEILLMGENVEKLREEGKKLKNLIINTAGANDVQLSAEDQNPEVKIDIDRDKLTQFGLNIATVGATLQNALYGNDDSKFRDKGTEFAIRVMLDAFDRKSPEAVKNITFTNAQGQNIKLSQFATVSNSVAPSILERKNRMSSVTVTSYTLGAGSGSVANNIKKQLETQPLSKDVSMVWEGDIKRQGESMGALGLAMSASVILMYLIMVALYDNFVYPFVVLFSIPVAIIGALFALNITMNNMGIFTMLGMLMLLGLVAKNAILLVDFTNQAKKEGHTSFEALVLSVKARMRPILMTTLAMVIGMLPIATATGAGSEWKNGLAWVLIGGLTSSMFLTLILVPLVYHSIDTVTVWVGKLFKKSDSMETKNIA